MLCKFKLCEPTISNPGEGADRVLHSWRRFQLGLEQGKHARTDLGPGCDGDLDRLPVGNLRFLEATGNGIGPRFFGELGNFGPKRGDGVGANVGAVLWR